MTLKEKIEVMYAYDCGGVEIEYFNKRLNTTWGKAYKPLWDWDSYDYRIKPEFKPKPFDIVYAGDNGGGIKAVFIMYNVGKCMCIPFDDFVWQTDIDILNDGFRNFKGTIEMIAFNKVYRYE